MNDWRKNQTVANKSEHDSSKRSKKAIQLFEKAYEPYRKQFETLYQEIIADGKVDKNDEVRLTNQINFLNEFIGVVAEVDTIYAKKQQDILYKIVGQ